MSRARFTPRGCGFIIPLPRSGQKGPRYFSFSPVRPRGDTEREKREGRGRKGWRRARETSERPRQVPLVDTLPSNPVTTHLPGHNGAAYALRASRDFALCIARPDFPRIPRRAFARYSPTTPIRIGKRVLVVASARFDEIVGKRGSFHRLLVDTRTQIHIHARYS